MTLSQEMATPSVDNPDSEAPAYGTKEHFDLLSRNGAFHGIKASAGSESPVPRYDTKPNGQSFKFKALEPTLPDHSSDSYKEGTVYPQIVTDVAGDPHPYENSFVGRTKWCGALCYGLVYTFHPVTIILWLLLTGLAAGAQYVFYRFGEHAVNRFLNAIYTSKPEETRDIREQNVFGLAFCAILLCAVYVVFPLFMPWISKNVYSRYARRQGLPEPDTLTACNVISLPLISFLFFAAYSLSVTLGMCMLLIPGILASVYFSMGCVAISVERANICRAFTRSIELVKGQFCVSLPYVLFTFSVCAAFLAPLAVMFYLYHPASQQAKENLTCWQIAHYSDKTRTIPATCVYFVMGQSAMTMLACTYAVVSLSTYFGYLRSKQLFL